MVKSFGRIWKIKSEEELAAYVSAHEHHLAAVLLFELAHEGQPIPAMKEAARLGGLERSFTRWAGRLQSMTNAHTNSAAAGQ